VSQTVYLLGQFHVRCQVLVGLLFPVQVVVPLIRRNVGNIRSCYFVSGITQLVCISQIEAKLLGVHRKMPSTYAESVFQIVFVGILEILVAFKNRHSG